MNFIFRKLYLEISIWNFYLEISKLIYMFLTQDYHNVKFTFTQLKENNYIKGMSCAYPKYETYKEDCLQSPWIY